MAEYHEIGLLKGLESLKLGAPVLAMYVMVFLNLLFLMVNGRTRPFLPRAPTTLASQIMYLCRSDRLLSDLAFTSKLSNYEMERRLKNIDQRCLLGWFWWRRRGAWFIDVEEFSHGESWDRFSFEKGDPDTAPVHEC